MRALNTYCFDGRHFSYQYVYAAVVANATHSSAAFAKRAIDIQSKEGDRIGHECACAMAHRVGSVECVLYDCMVVTVYSFRICQQLVTCGYFSIIVFSPFIPCYFECSRGVLVFRSAVASRERMKKKHEQLPPI